MPRFLLVPLLLAGALVAAYPAALAAQAQSTPADLEEDLAAGPNARMSMLFERTIFQVDVLRLDIRVGPDAAARIDSLLASPGSEALGDSVAAVALAARDVLTRIEFLRDTGFERFLEGIRDNLRRAQEGGMISADEFTDIARNLRDWYDFLAERGIRSGDRMLQRVRGDTLRTVYLSAAGETLLDQVDSGAHRRLAVLGGYFAPGSDFRDGLVESLLDTD